MLNDGRDDINAVEPEHQLKNYSKIMYVIIYYAIGRKIKKQQQSKRKRKKAYVYASYTRERGGVYNVRRINSTRYHRRTRVVTIIRIITTPPPINHADAGGDVPDGAHN